MKYVPKRFLAGTFPTVKLTGVAGGTIAEGDIVTVTDDKVVAATSETIANACGIAGHAAIKDVPVTYYGTGEYFAEGVNMPEGVEVKTAQAALAKLNIYLK